MNSRNRNIAILFLLFYLPVAMGGLFFHTHDVIQNQSKVHYSLDEAESLFSTDDHCATCKILASSYIQATGDVNINPNTSDDIFASVRQIFSNQAAQLFSNRAPPFLI